jgi:hypothetical protein
MCYCEIVKNITLAVPDDVYRAARILAAERSTSVSGLVAEYLGQLSEQASRFSFLEAEQRRIQQRIDHFRAGDRVRRDEAHDRAVR